MLLEKRSEELRVHAGEVRSVAIFVQVCRDADVSSFPGGKADPVSTPKVGLRVMY